MANVFNAQPEPVEPPVPGASAPVAWQPLTFRGVAAFASAAYMRLFWVQTVFAILAAGTIVWALNYTWAPVIRAAVRNLPNETSVRTEQLVHAPSAPPLLAESRHLAVLLKPDGATAASDVRIEFRPRSVRVCSLFGCLVRDYPKSKVIYFTRQDAIPWWGAWQPVLLGIVGILSALGFLAVWTVLASVVFLFVRLYAYFADRQTTLGGSWRLSAAALLPASLVLVAAMILYALGSADLIQFLIAVPGHLLIALVYLTYAPRRLSRVPTVPDPVANPFKTA